MRHIHVIDQKLCRQKADAKLCSLCPKTLQDKYTGPLGAASLDSALLTVLYHGRASKGSPKNVIFMEKSQMLFSNVKEDVKRKLFLFTSEDQKE